MEEEKTKRDESFLFSHSIVPYFVEKEALAQQLQANLSQLKSQLEEEIKKVATSEANGINPL
jgi:hypothetical protein